MIVVEAIGWATVALFVWGLLVVFYEHPATVWWNFWGNGMGSATRRVVCHATGLDFTPWIPWMNPPLSPTISRDDYRRALMARGRI